jgi:hypothetical protein
VNGEDLPGNFLLQLNVDPRYVGIHRNVAASFECEERPDPSRLLSNGKRSRAKSSCTFIIVSSPIALARMLPAVPR